MKKLALLLLMILGWVGPAQAQPACTMPPGAASIEPIQATRVPPNFPVPHDISGTQTELLVTIDTTGVPRQAEVLRSSGSAWIDQSAIAYVLDTWRWKPPMVDCKPIEVRHQVNVRWR